MRRFRAVFILALIVRLFLVFIAYHGDLNNNISWGTLAAQRGLPGFYESGSLPREAGGEVGWPYSAPNQPPLTILMLAGVRWIWQLVENTIWWANNNFPLFYSPFIWWWEQNGMVLLVKLPGILADLGIAWLIYQYFRQKDKLKLGLRLSALWLFNPVTWYNSAIWGQTDAVVNFLGLASIFYLLQKRLVLFTVFFVLSLLFKGSLLIFAPILLVVALWQRQKVGEWLKSAVATLFVVVATSIWFHPQADIFTWLFNLYNSRILPGEIGYLTANAFNFWWLVDPGRTMDSTIYFGLPARVWGFAIFITGFAFIALWLRKRLTDKRLFFALALTTLLVFLFMTRIHERYLYPFFPYATMIVGLVPGFVIPYVVLSITHLLNLYHLFWAPSFAPLEALYKNPQFMQTLSLVNIAAFFWLIRIRRLT